MDGTWYLRVFLGLWLMLCGLCGLCAPAAAHVVQVRSEILAAPIGTPSETAFAVHRQAIDQPLSGSVWEWVDGTGRLTLEQVLAAEQAGTAKFAPAAKELEVKDLRGQSALWMRFRLAYQPDVVADHVVYLPLPFLDRVDFHVREPDGSWQTYQAGDTVAISNWPERTRFPALRLHPIPGQERLIYLRVHQGTATPLPLLIDESAHFNWDERLDMLIFGGVAGALVLLTLVCALQAWAFRDGDFAKLAGFCLLMTFGLATYNGVLPLMLGGRTDLWADASQAVMFCLIASAGVYLVWMVLNGVGVSPVLMRCAKGVSAVGVPLALLTVMTPRPVVAQIIPVYVVLTTAVAVWSCVAAWRARAKSATWLGVAFVPMVLAIAALSGRLLGWDVPLWASTHALTIATALHLPLLVVAMNIRARDSHMAHTRTRALEKQDALTGLLAGHLFEDRVARVIGKQPSARTSGAVVLFKIANYKRIRDALGPTASDDLLLRASVRVRKVMGNSENLARLGEAEFGVLFDVQDDRVAVQEICARLVAVGLMPMKALTKGVSLNYQCAVLMLADSKLAAPDAIASLRAELEGMASRTRRPIRFVDSASLAAGAAPADDAQARTEAERKPDFGPESDSNLDAQDQALAPTVLDSVSPDEARAPAYNVVPMPLPKLG